MANASDNYGLILPVDGEFIEINDLNYNFEKIDNVMWDNRRISVAMYNTARTYNTGSLAGHEDANGHIHAYRCLADNVTGTWDATKWTLTDLASEIEDIRENAGTDVEANPSGTATDTLEKLRVDSTIYAIPEDVVSKEAEGNPIEITDGASAPLVKCVTEIQGYQSGTGTPSPSNIRPITAYTEGEIEVRGKNLISGKLDNSNIAGNGSIGTSSSIDYNLYYAKVIQNMIYTFSDGVTEGADSVYAFFTSIPTTGAISYNGNRVVSNNHTFTAPIDGYVAFRTEHNYATPQCELGSTATTYEPYTSTTHTTTYPSAIYRGSEDVVNGEVTNDMPVIDLGDLTWTAALTDTENKYRFKATVSGIKRSPSASDVPNIICSHYASVSMNNTYRCIDGITVDNNSDQIYIYVDSLSNVSGAVFQSNMVGVKIAYELATPTTSSVTPTNLPIKSLNGYSHIESTTGDMEVEYITEAFSPITELVDSQISALQKMMELMLTANREAEMIATQNYTAGDLLIVSGKLYKASSNIANGSTLVINSNVTSTTIAAELAALA